MRKSALYISIVLIMAIIQSCGPTPPLKADVEARIFGAYCDSTGNYRLDLKKDMTYMNRRVEIGPLGVGSQRDACLGDFTLELVNEKEWVVSFGKDDRTAAPLQSCEKSFVIWSPEQGYTMGDEQKIMIKDLFDGKELTKGACDY
ncbi:MAG: hypothetical protein AAFQ83_12920 [Bacteroidota bacterium]